MESPAAVAYRVRAKLAAIAHYPLPTEQRNPPDV
jgi:hypothetical protein